MSIPATNRIADTTKPPTQPSSDPDRLSTLFISQPRQESTSSTRGFSESKRFSTEPASHTVNDVFKTATTTTTQTDGYTLIFGCHKRVLTAEEKDLLSQKSDYFKTIFNASGFRESATQTACCDTISIENFEDLLLFLKDPQRNLDDLQLYNVLCVQEYFLIKTSQNHNDLILEKIKKIDSKNPLKADFSFLTNFIAFDYFYEEVNKKIQNILNDFNISQLEHYSDFIKSLAKINDAIEIPRHLAHFIHQAFKLETFPQFLRELNIDSLFFNDNFTNQDLEKCVEFFPDLKKLAIHSKALTELDPLKKYLNLIFLDLSDCKYITSLEPLANAPLTYLNLFNCLPIHGLYSLNSTQLKFLDISDLKTNINSYFQHSNLEHLSIYEISKFDLISFDFPNLITLNIKHMKIDSQNSEEKSQLKAAIQKCVNLKKVNIAFNAHLSKDLFPDTVVVTDSYFGQIESNSEYYKALSIR